MGKHSAQQLHYMDDNQISLGSDRLTGFLAEIFSKFGDEPTDWIYAEKNGCFLISPGGENVEACHLSRDDLRPHIILLPYNFFERYDRNPRGTTMLILHEVAHGFLDHHGTTSPDVEKQQEREAWKLAAKWYRSSDLSQACERKRK